LVKLDGKSPDEFGLLFLKDHYHPATPEMRNRTMTIPGMPGEWDFGSEWGNRPFNLPFAIIEYDRYELQRKLRAFVAFLMDAYGKPREIRLTFDYEPDKYYSVKIAGKVDVERAVHTGRFNLPLIAHKPFAYAEMNAYDPMDEPVYGEASTEDYYANTSSFLWQYSNHYSGVHNYSSLITDFDVVIEGTVLNPSITHLEANKKLLLPSLNNQKLELDSARFIMKVDGVSQLAGTDFFSLLPGDNGFLFEGESPNATVTYKWKHKFI